MKIPVFTVLKNNSILKNIFLSDVPPPSNSPEEKENFPIKNQEKEETFVVGRHPDCNITLQHPSISRFHLRIHSIPSLQYLSVFDLSSVHGTWISGKRIEAGVRVELQEGDTLQLGVSSRIYRLHWVPLSREYDFNKRSLPPLDELRPLEEREEETRKDENTFCGGKGEERDEDEDYLCFDGHGQTLDDTLEGLKLLFTDMNLSQQSKTGTSSPCAFDGTKSSVLFQEDIMIKSSFKSHDSTCHLVKESMVEEKGKGFLSPQLDASLAADDDLEALSCLLKDMNIITQQNQWTGSEFLMPPVERPPFPHEVEAEDKTQSFSSSTSMQLVSQVKQWTPSAPMDPEGTESGVICEEEREKNDPLELGGITSLQSSNINNNYWIPSAPLLPENANSGFCSGDEEENETRLYCNGITDLQSIRKDDNQNKSINAAFSFGKSESELPGPDAQSISDVSIWKRRGKSACVQIQTHRTGECSSSTCSNSEVKLLNQENLKIGPVSEYFYKSRDKAEESFFTPDKENSRPDFIWKESLKKIGCIKVESTSLNLVTYSWDRASEEGFTPNKENISPKSLLLRSKKKVKLGESKHSKTYRSSPLKNADLNIHPLVGKSGSSDRESEEAFTPNKENISPNETLLLRSKKKVEMGESKHSKIYRSSPSKNEDLKSHPLVVKSGSSDKGFELQKVLHGEKNTAVFAFRSHVNYEPETNVSKGRPQRAPFQLLKVTSNSSTFDASDVKEKNNNWTMIVDTACLLKKESRKALELMQGLPRTNLIVPRIVIRELDCLKRPAGLFRSTKQASAALRWIEECMFNAHAWIHVQSVVEDRMQIAPTPPAFPFSHFSGDKMKFQAGWISFSPRDDSLEIVSPTTEDHILDCAMLFRRNGDNVRTVLLSDNLSLKIKAMAEGLLCETAEEFRESLVNPFSERFLWTHSSPRGPTWSCTDDVFLKNIYYNGPSKNQSKSGESAKGLKLILAHNSKFRPTSIVN